MLASSLRPDRPFLGLPRVNIQACLQANRRLVVSFGGDIFPCDTASGPRSAGGPASCGGRLQHGRRRALSPIRHNRLPTVLVSAGAFTAPVCPPGEKGTGGGPAAPFAAPSAEVGRGRKGAACLSEAQLREFSAARDRPRSEGIPGRVSGPGCGSRGDFFGSFLGQARKDLAARSRESAPPGGSQSPGLRSASSKPRGSGQARAWPFSRHSGGPGRID